MSAKPESKRRTWLWVLGGGFGALVLALALKPTPEIIDPTPPDVPNVTIDIGLVDFTDDAVIAAASGAAQKVGTALTYSWEYEMDSGSGKPYIIHEIDPRRVEAKELFDEAAYPPTIPSIDLALFYPTVGGEVVAQLSQTTKRQATFTVMVPFTGVAAIEGDWVVWADGQMWWSVTEEKVNGRWLATAAEFVDATWDAGRDKAAQEYWFAHKDDLPPVVLTPDVATWVVDKSSLAGVAKKSQKEPNPIYDSLVSWAAEVGVTLSRFVDSDARQSEAGYLFVNPALVPLAPNVKTLVPDQYLPQTKVAASIDDTAVVLVTLPVSGRDEHGKGYTASLTWAVCGQYRGETWVALWAVLNDFAVNKHQF